MVISAHARSVRAFPPWNPEIKSLVSSLLLFNFKSENTPEASNISNETQKEEYVEEE